MIRLTLAVPLLAGAFAVAPAQAAEDQSDAALTQTAASPVDAISDGGMLLELRPRYAHVDQADKMKAADAYTMRTLLGWRTRYWEDLAATVQMLNVGHFGPKYYASGSTGPSPYPLVRDADNTDVNHLYVDYGGIAKTVLRIGRQDLILDNERMVGVKNFSQTPQVFDAVTVKNQFLSATDLFFGHFWRERTTSTTDLRSNTSLLNARISFADRGSLAAYAYFQDQPDTGQTTGFRDNSNRIAGLRLDGAQAIRENLNALYTAEYARQRSYADGDSRIDADYARIGGGIEWRGLFVRADQERLGSNRSAYAFQTPIGSTHSFQGWADLFTTTPKQGLIDTFATLGFTVRSVAVYAERHQFRSDVSDIDFGNELDVRLSYQVLKSLVARLEFADYNAVSASAGNPDTRKIWVTLLYNY
ncbi:MAG TPA: alginate export family protein [Burkholderiales bacterium]|nr:alginate export family protein [Burkholderiales bacterium]